MVLSEFPVNLDWRDRCGERRISAMRCSFSHKDTAYLNDLYWFNDEITTNE